MLQIRSALCPKCKEENPSDALICVTCGSRLAWSEDRPLPPPPVVQTAAAATTDWVKFWKLLFFFVGLCLLTVVVVNYRYTHALPFSGNPEALEVPADHATMIQDAESLRQELMTPEAKADLINIPEAAYIVSINMPADAELLEITVSQSWHLLDRATRRQYARNIAARWKRVHAPHRALFRLLSLDGTEVGGRSWSDRIWVMSGTPPGVSMTPSPVVSPQVSGTATPAAGPVSSSGGGAAPDSPGDNGAAVRTPMPAAAATPAAAPSGNDRLLNRRLPPESNFD